MLDHLLQTVSFETFLSELNRYAGHYVIIYCSGNDLFLFNDMCGQYEIYYDTTYSAFGSQPKLIGEFTELIPHTEQNAVEFFTSAKFIARKKLIGTSTHFFNIKHLLPNHYIDIRSKTVRRFFPSVPLVSCSISEVVPKICRMLSGYIKSASLRKKIAMAVTAGYDSRILFFSVPDDVECKYYVGRHRNRPVHHHDLVVPLNLTHMCNKSFEIIPLVNLYDDFSHSVDFPTTIYNLGKSYDNHIFLSGGLSEIARCFYGNWDKLSPEDLAFISGYKNFRFVINEYKHWLKDAGIFCACNYNAGDMYYWEQRMGIMAGRHDTSSKACGVHTFSPYSSRELMMTLLSVPRKYRKKNMNKLYHSILLHLSPKALSLPFNPSRKENMIRLMMHCKIYDLYRYLGLKFRFLKF